MAAAPAACWGAGCWAGVGHAQHQAPGTRPGAPAPRSRRRRRVPLPATARSCCRGAAGCQRLHTAQPAAQLRTVALLHGHGGTPASPAPTHSRPNPCTAAEGPHCSGSAPRWPPLRVSAVGRQHCHPSRHGPRPPVLRPAGGGAWGGGGPQFGEHPARRQLSVPLLFPQPAPPPRGRWLGGGGVHRDASARPRAAQRGQINQWRASAERTGHPLPPASCGHRCAAPSLRTLPPPLPLPRSHINS